MIVICAKTKKMNYSKMQSKAYFFTKKAHPSFGTIFEKKGIKRYTLRTKNAQKWYHVCVKNFYRNIFATIFDSIDMIDDNKSENTVFVAPPKTLFWPFFYTFISITI